MGLAGDTYSLAGGLRFIYLLMWWLHDITYLCNVSTFGKFIALFPAAATKKKTVEWTVFFGKDFTFLIFVSLSQSLKICPMVTPQIEAHVILFPTTSHLPKLNVVWLQFLNIIIFHYGQDFFNIFINFCDFTSDWRE